MTGGVPRSTHTAAPAGAQQFREERTRVGGAVPSAAARGKGCPHVPRGRGAPTAAGFPAWAGLSTENPALSCRARRARVLSAQEPSRGRGRSWSHCWACGFPVKAVFTRVLHLCHHLQAQSRFLFHLRLGRVSVQGLGGVLTSHCSPLSLSSPPVISLTPHPPPRSLGPPTPEPSPLLCCRNLRSRPVRSAQTMPISTSLLF